MTRDEWLKATHLAIRQAITTCYETHLEGGWIENTITRDVLKAIGIKQSIAWGDSPFQSELRAFKATGPHETANGDIALRVTLSTSSGASVVGTKYLEAKKWDIAAGRYASLDRDQLLRMQHIPGHEVLFYTVRALTDPPQTIVGEAGCLASPMVLMLGGEGRRAIHSAWAPFSHTLYFALTGRGLNWDPRHAAAFASALAHLESKPSFFVDAHVGVRSPALEFEPSFAPDGYRPLSPHDIQRTAERDEPRKRDRSRDMGPEL
jgi:hypothetical protein